MLRLNLIQQHLTVSHMNSTQSNHQPLKYAETAAVEDESLFSPEILLDLRWAERKPSYKGDIDYLQPAPGLVLRPLALTDYELGFLSILSELTKVGPVTREQFSSRFRAMQQCSGTYYVLVVEDRARGRVVGCATLVVEQKFIHQTATRGRIEDVVVSEECRGKQLGKLLVDVLGLLARKLGCYKLSLECDNKNIKFYEALGFKLDGQNFMTQRFRD